jgi:hypothetical protein
MKQATDLQSRFYNSFDGSALLSFVHRLLNLSDEEKRGLDSFLGEGFHFQSFEYKAHALPLAVNLAKSSFLRQGDLVLNRWKRAMEIARSMERVSLIPPMEVISGQNYLAVVMPKGQVLAKIQERKVDDLLRDTAKALSEVGLALDDYPQLREACGVPFIIDWSDLNFVTSQR